MQRPQHAAPPGRQPCAAAQRQARVGAKARVGPADKFPRRPPPSTRGRQSTSGLRRAAQPTLEGEAPPRGAAAPPSVCERRRSGDAATLARRAIRYVTPRRRATLRARVRGRTHPLRASFGGYRGRPWCDGHSEAWIKSRPTRVVTPRTEVKPMVNPAGVRRHELRKYVCLCVPRWCQLLTSTRLGSKTQQNYNHLFAYSTLSPALSLALILYPSRRRSRNPAALTRRPLPSRRRRT